MDYEQKIFAMLEKKKDAPSTDHLGTKEDKDFLFVLIPISIHFVHHTDNTLLYR